MSFFEGMKKAIAGNHLHDISNSIADYAESLDDDELNKKFSQYLARGLQPTDLPQHFEEIKNKIDEAEV